MDAWIVAGVAVLGVLGQIWVTGSRTGEHTQQLRSHEKRLDIVEVTVGEHTSEIGELKGASKAHIKTAHTEGIPYRPLERE